MSVLNDPINIDLKHKLEKILNEITHQCLPSSGSGREYVVQRARAQVSIHQEVMDLVNTRLKEHTDALVENSD